jgi:hypothetical protein
MSAERRELTRLKFEGPRFDDHGLDFDVLPDLIAYKDLLVKTAVGLWWAKHPDRQRIDRGFEDSIRLKFFEIGAGSATVPVFRIIEGDGEQMALPLEPDEFDDAVDLIEETIAAAADDRLLPERLPANVVHLFGSFGKSLLPGESISLSGAKRGRAVRHTPEIRERLERWQDKTYEDTVDLAGEVRLTDLDGRKFTIRLDNGLKVKGEFLPEQELMITTALREHESRRLRVRGKAEHSCADGSLKRLVRVDDIVPLPVDYDTFDDAARPIWEVVAEMGAEISDSEWAEVPRDLAGNHDHYLYDAPRVKR